ncbi:MAG: hypothetical protein HZA61_01860 [Candidatus Eisenbacteria bacterium]|uniref:SelT/SelW/SelH family protein n=1 Tax=Eiseniibacteriota bacterium TaxID=2212470 RepID=A0A933S937_UNCEI|nr:hypothetical protein [Candidatus Eisenbacteria bacterium]
MAAEIQRERGITPTLVKGTGGVFEVTIDGKLVFSKKALGRHAEIDEILALIPAT